MNTWRKICSSPFASTARVKDLPDASAGAVESEGGSPALESAAPECLELDLLLGYFPEQAGEPQEVDVLLECAPEQARGSASVDFLLSDDSDPAAVIRGLDRPWDPGSPDGAAWDAGAVELEDPRTGDVPSEWFDDSPSQAASPAPRKRCKRPRRKTPKIHATATGEAADAQARSEIASEHGSGESRRMGLSTREYVALLVALAIGCGAGATGGIGLMEHPESLVDTIIGVAAIGFFCGGGLLFLIVVTSSFFGGWLRLR